MFFSSIKEEGKWLISNIYYWEKLTFSKLKFSRKENLKKCTSFEEQKGTRYIPGNIYFGIIIFSCFLSTKPCLRFLLICFLWEIRGFYQSSLGNEVDFTDLINVSQIPLLKIKISKSWDMVLWMKEQLTYQRKNWKCIFNTSRELLQIHTEKQIMPLKATIKWLFNYIWYYLVIGCFDWKIGVFQQTVARVYCILDFI